MGDTGGYKAVDTLVQGSKSKTEVGAEAKKPTTHIDSSSRPTSSLHPVKEKKTLAETLKEVADETAHNVAKTSEETRRSLEGAYEKLQGVIDAPKTTLTRDQNKKEGSTAKETGSRSEKKNECHYNLRYRSKRGGGNG